MQYQTSTTFNAAIDRLATRQRGLITTRQLRAIGMTAVQRERRIARGDLVLVRRGLFRCAGVSSDWEMMAMAAVLVAGPGAVVSHLTAGRLWDLLDANRPIGRPSIHVTAPRRIEAAGLSTHQLELLQIEVARRHGIPVTSAARTIADLAGEPSVSTEELGTFVDQALRRRLVGLVELQAALVRGGGRGRRSLAKLRSVLGARTVGYEPGANDWERDMDEWWDAAGLPPATRQYRTTVNGRKFVIDRAIVDLRIAVEWNGFAFHGQYRSGFDATTLRQLALVEGGWAYIPVTTRTPLDAVCRAVWSAVAQRSPG